MTTFPPQLLRFYHSHPTQAHANQGSALQILRRHASMFQLQDQLDNSETTNRESTDGQSSLFKASSAYGQPDSSAQISITKCHKTKSLSPRDSAVVSCSLHQSAKFFPTASGWPSRGHQVQAGFPCHDNLAGLCISHARPAPTTGADAYRILSLEGRGCTEECILRPLGGFSDLIIGLCAVS